MSLMPKAVVEKPSRSNVNLSFINRFSAAPGLLYPVMVKDAYAADDFSVDLSSLCKTLPLQGPLMGSFKVQFDSFFIPYRLYLRTLHQNRAFVDPDRVNFPYFAINYVTIKSPTIETNDTLETRDPRCSRGVHPSSLFHFLGVPEYFGRVDPPVDWDFRYHTGGSDSDASLNEKNYQKYLDTFYGYRYFNGVPLLGYYDIVVNYYANLQEDNFYICGWSNQTGDLYGSAVNLAPCSVSDWNDIRDSLLSHDDSVTGWYCNSPTGSASNVLKLALTVAPHVPLGGLACRTYLPDRFNAWLSSSRYTIISNSSMVTVSGDKFSIDSLRLANKLNRMDLRTLVSGGTYKDWLIVQYGSAYRDVIEIPEFISSCSYELQFEDVIQTSSSVEGSPLGELGGRGVGFTQGRKFRYYVKEHGFIMTLMSIVPRVDYYQGVKHYMRQLTLGDLHVPEMDGIGFQDLLTDDFAAYDSLLKGNKVTYQSIGKQPAFTELMTATNELHGTFAYDSSIPIVARAGTQYLTLVRIYKPNEVGGSDDAIISNSSTYIDPIYYNYAFADASRTAENFWLQCRFDVFVKRAISKRVMPSL